MELKAVYIWLTLLYNETKITAFKNWVMYHIYLEREVNFEICTGQSVKCIIYVGHRLVV